MGQVRGVQKRGDTYFARIVIPAELRPALDGKHELRQRLGTDKREAERASHGVLASFHERIAQARLSIKAEKAPPRPRPLPLAALAQAVYKERLANDERARDLSRTSTSLDDDLTLSPDEMDGLEATLRAEETANLKRIAAGKASDDEIASGIGADLARLARRGSLVCEPGTDEWRRTARTLAGVLTEVAQRQTERDQGDFTGRPSLPILAERAQVEPQPPADGGPALRPESLLPLSEVVPLMHSEKTGIRPATAAEHVIACRMFEEALGELRPVHRVTRRDVIKFKDLLRLTPTLYANRFPGLSLPEAIEVNQRRLTPFPTLSATTINNKWLCHISAILNRAARNDIVSANVAKGVRVDTGGGDDAEPGRIAFSAEDMGVIVRAALATPDEERRWAVLIAAYSGMRAAEVAQLRLDGIRLERDVLVFEVAGELKTAGSRRLVPVNSFLAEHGLKTRVAALRAAGHDRLFPTWFKRAEEVRRRAAARGKVVQQPFATILPRWFNKFLLPKLGIADRRKTFHSLRHTFKTSMATAGISREISDALTGHKDHSVGARYIHGVSINKMRDAVEQVRYIQSQPYI